MFQKVEQQDGPEDDVEDVKSNKQSLDSRGRHPDSRDVPYPKGKDHGDQQGQGHGLFGRGLKRYEQGPRQ